MDNNTALPIQVGFQKAKDEILQAINQIGSRYEIPSALIILLVEQIVQDSKINAYETIIGRYDIKLPEGVETTKPKNTKPMENDDVEMSLETKKVKK